MDVLLHVVAYASVVVFLIAVIARFIRIESYPLHLRWEIYPVPHEGRRAEHGGSRLEEGDWWEKEHKPDKLRELKFMIPEMLFIKALYEHNRKLWLRSFPFHFGLYLMVGFAGLLALSAILEMTGMKFEGRSLNSIAGILTWMTALVGMAGIALGILGGVGLLIMRLTDVDLKPYTNFSHLFNLVFIVAALGLLLAAMFSSELHLGFLRYFFASLFGFKLSYVAENGWQTAAILTTALLVAYIPLTHMSHFFVKWFTWHKIRWDDEPNVKGGRFEVLIENALKAPVSWPAAHIKADGKKSWVEIAIEEVEK